jgi:hypothetical protein
MQKWMKCSVPPMRQADVFGAGNGTLFGKMDISKAIREGKAVILALKVSQTVAKGEGEKKRMDVDESITFHKGSSCARHAWSVRPSRSGYRSRFFVHLDVWDLEVSTVGSASPVRLPSRRADSQRLRETRVEIE